MQELAPDIYYSKEFALTIVGAVLTEEGWICIDTPPYPRDAKTWIGQLREIADKPVKYVINTDHHRDRILGNSHFDAPVVAHEFTTERVLGLKKSFISQAAEALSANDNELVEIASLKIVPPHISCDQRLYLQGGNREVIVESYPGPTAGSTWVVFAEEKIVFVGDSVVLDRHPYIDQGR